MSLHSGRRRSSAQLLTVYEALCLEAVYSSLLLLGATNTSHTICNVSLIMFWRHVGIEKFPSLAAVQSRTSSIRVCVTFGLPAPLRLTYNNGYLF